MYNIPLFDLNYGKEEEDAVIETIRSKWISSGPKCAELETAFAGMIGVGHALALSSSTAALHLACYSLGLKEGDEVICPSLTFAATVNAIRYTGAVPVFCDIKSTSDLTIDPAMIRELITEKTRAIIVMDYAGFPCDMDEIMTIARENGLKVIEDACHGPLSEYKGKCLGSIGDIGCFSFFSNKNISTGEGGMLTTNDAEIYERCKYLRSHGMTTMSYQRAMGHATKYDITEIGFNYRMDDIRASLGLAQLGKLRADLIKRAEIRKHYEHFLGDVEEVTVPFTENGSFVSNYIMPVIINDSTAERRDRIRDLIHSKGVQTSVHYPAVHRFSAYSGYKASLPVTEYVTDNEITVPMYSALTLDQVRYICETVREAVKQIH